MFRHVSTTFWSRSLFPFDTDSKRLETTVSRSMSAQVSLMLVRLATELKSAISLLEPVPDEPSFNKVGTVLAAVCWLLLDAPECRGKLRSGSGDCRVVLLLETDVSGRRVDRCVLATDIDAELGLTTCVWSRIGQMARWSTPERNGTRVQSDSSQWSVWW